MDASWEQTVEQLTLQATHAAEEGRWANVDQCYQQRAELFRAHNVSGSLARRLRAMDSTIYDRLRMATMAVQHLLTEVTLKQRLVGRFQPTSECDVFPKRPGGVSRRV